MSMSQEVGSSPRRTRRSLYLPSSSPSSKRVKNVEDDCPDVRSNCPEEERDALHTQGEQRVLKIVEQLEQGWNKKIAKQVESFLQKGEEIIKGGGGTVTPIAFVPSSSSVDEDKECFAAIEKQIDGMDGKMFSYARISKVKCPSVKSAFQSICSQLDCSDCSTPQGLKRKMMEESNPVGIIVVLIENAHHFVPNVVSQLIRLLSSASLPFVFVLGVMNHGTGDLSRFIPSEGSCAFVYSSFETVTATERLNQMFHKLIDPDVWPIVLDGKIVEYLRKFYSRNHSSIKRLTQAIQICLLEHYRKPETIMCSVPSTFTTEQKGTNLCKTIEARRLDELAKAANLTGILKGSQLRDKMIEGWSTVTNWNFCLQIVCFIQALLQKVPPSDLAIDLYIDISSGTFFEAPEGSVQTPCDRLVTEIKNLSKSQLTRVINELYDEIGLINAKDQQGGVIFDRRSEAYIVHSNIADIVDSLNKIVDEVASFEEREKQQEKENANPSPKKRPNKYHGVMKREDLQQQLKAQIEKTSVSKPLADLKTSFTNFIQTLFKTYLKPFNKILKDPCYKAFVFDDLDGLRSLFSPDPCSYITNCLTFPSKIVLDCKCCRSLGPSATAPSLPDVSLVFKLLKEQVHKKVDLNMLYDAFLSVHDTQNAPSSSKSRRNSTKPKPQDTDAFLLRFRQAIAELQFIGVLKRSRSKPDEITKLIWI